MPGQLLRISDFERDVAVQARAVARPAPARLYKFPARIPMNKKRNSVRAWQRGLDIALRIEFGCVLFLTAIWLLWHFIH